MDKRAKRIEILQRRADDAGTALDRACRVMRSAYAHVERRRAHLVAALAAVDALHAEAGRG